MALTKITESVIQRFSKWFNVNSTTGAVTSIVPDLIGSNTTLYPSFACRAFVNFNGTSALNLTGTYSQSGTTITITINNHGLLTGHQVRLSFDSGTASWGTDSISPTVTRIDNNIFTLTSGASKTTSGNTTAYFRTIRGSGNVSNVSYNGTGDYTVNFTTAMPDNNYCPFVGSHRLDSVLDSGGAVYGGTYNTHVTSSSLRVITQYQSSAGQYDAQGVFVGIFR